MRIQNRCITDETIVLDETTDEVSFIGPNAHLVRCRVVLKAPVKAYTLTRARFTDCIIDAKHEVTSDEWHDSDFSGCTFLGRFSGLGFGAWPEVYADGGSIVNCDFRQALLDGCTFMNTDMQTIALPTWPCFTFLQPHSHADEIQGADWPKALEPLVDVLLTAPRGTSAIVQYAPAVIKDLGGHEEDLRQVLQHLPHVRM